MRTALTNPFSPGSDTIPAVWAGRIEQLRDWREVVRPRRIAGLPERGRTILGEPGLGKSSLTRRIAHDAAKAGDWVTPQLRIPSRTDPLKVVATAVLELADQAGLPASRDQRISDALNRVQSVAVSGVALSLRQEDGPEPHSALATLLIEVGRAALARGNMALIHIDEVQNISDGHALSQLLIALGDALSHEEIVTVPGNRQISRHLPLAVYLTGLPEFEDMAGAQKGATFARRFKTTTLEALSDEELAAALQPFVTDGWEVPDEQGGVAHIHMEREAADAVIDVCRGEPFLFQLAGEYAWYGGTGETITRDHVLNGWRNAQREAAAHVERILARLPPREREFLEAMSRRPAAERTLTQIATDLGYAKATDAGPTSRRLDTVRAIIGRGKPYTFRHRAIEAYLTSDWPRTD